MRRAPQAVTPWKHLTKIPAQGATVTPSLSYVAMFDVLGFKALRARLGTAELYKLFDRSISVSIQHSAAGAGRVETRNGVPQYVPVFSENSIAYQCISDTVILYTKDASVASFFRIVTASYDLVRSGFMGHKAPFRGAIGYGDLVADAPHAILIGSAIEDAYLGESRQAWAGVSLTAGCRDHVYSSGIVRQHDEQIDASPQATPDQKKMLKKRLVRYDVPIKTGNGAFGTLDTLAIDWTAGMYEGAAEKSFEAAEDEQAAIKARNTIAFETWVRSQPDVLR